VNSEKLVRTGCPSSGKKLSIQCRNQERRLAKNSLMPGGPPVGEDHLPNYFFWPEIVCQLIRKLMGKRHDGYGALWSGAVTPVDFS
jgi:hypothetical protein